VKTLFKISYLSLPDFLKVNRCVYGRVFRCVLNLFLMHFECDLVCVVLCVFEIFFDVVLMRI
jgi:hypothetical protein